MHVATAYMCKLKTAKSIVYPICGFVEKIELMQILKMMNLTKLRCFFIHLWFSKRKGSKVLNLSMVFTF